MSASISNESILPVLYTLLSCFQIYFKWLCVIKHLDLLPGCWCIPEQMFSLHHQIYYLVFFHLVFSTSAFRNSSSREVQIVLLLSAFISMLPGFLPPEFPSLVSVGVWWGSFFPVYFWPPHPMLSSFYSAFQGLNHV